MATVTVALANEVISYPVALFREFDLIQDWIKSPDTQQSEEPLPLFQLTSQTLEEALALASGQERKSLPSPALFAALHFLQYHYLEDLIDLFHEDLILYLDSFKHMVCPDPRPTLPDLTILEEYSLRMLQMLFAPATQTSWNWVDRLLLRRVLGLPLTQQFFPQSSRPLIRAENRWMEKILSFCPQLFGQKVQETDKAWTDAVELLLLLTRESHQEKIRELQEKLAQAESLPQEEQIFLLILCGIAVVLHLNFFLQVILTPDQIPWGSTLLEMATSANNLEAYRLLLPSALHSQAHWRLVPRVLVAAARTGAAEVLTEFLTFYLSPQVVLDSGALEHAIRAGSPKVVRLLLSKGIAPQDLTQFSPLLLEMSVRQNQTKVLQEFCRHGLRFSQVGLRESHLLLSALSANQVEILQVMKEAGCSSSELVDCAQKNLFLLGRHRDTSTLEFLLSEGLPQKVLLSHAGEILEEALISSSLQVARYLLPLLKNPRRTLRRVLPRALPHLQLASVQFLLEAGVTVEDLQLRNNCLLRKASLWGDGELIRFLFNQGLPLSALQAEDYDALGTLILRGDFSLLQDLVKQGLSLQDLRGHNNLALQKAVRRGEPEILQFLLQQGLTVQDLRSGNNRALETALRQNSAEMVLSLLQAGLDRKDLQDKEQLIKPELRKTLQTAGWTI